MSRIVLFAFIIILLSPLTARACSCGGPPISVSEFVKDVTIVTGTTIKTEWQEIDVPSPVIDREWWKRAHLQTQTTLKDARDLSFAPLGEFSFYHQATGQSSCGMQPSMGRTNAFVLTRDDYDNFVYSFCTARAVPVGAILDYAVNGQDAVVPPRRACNLHKLRVKRANDTGKDAPMPAHDCTFWDPDNQSRLGHIWADHQKALRTLANEGDLRESE